MCHNCVCVYVITVLFVYGCFFFSYSVLGYRSLTRDIEFQVALVTHDEDLQKALHSVSVQFKLCSTFNCMMCVCVQLGKERVIWQRENA